MGLRDVARSVFRPYSTTEEEARGSYSFSEYMGLVEYAFNGNTYMGYASTMSPDKQEELGDNFSAYVQGVYKRNGIVSAAIVTRAQVFSEVQFAMRDRTSYEMSPLPASARILENPDVNMTQGELLWRMEQDVSLAGNWYGVRIGNKIRRLRPDWVTIMLSESPEDPDTEVVGYLYDPPSQDAQAFLPEQVAHWSPEPDPEATFRGMSWITPILREIQSDSAATDHKLKFFENAATPNLIISAPESVTNPEQFRIFKDAIDEDQSGRFNAYKTMYLAAGSSVTPVGADLQQLDFKATQGAGETRIASRARVPAVLLGISEGLGGSSLNAGNYGMARRQFADGFLRPHWRSACAALSSLVPVPAGQELWYDERRVAFLREDEKDNAEIQSTQAAAIRQLVDGGFVPDSVINAVVTDDMTQLEHSGFLSVQLMPISVEDGAMEQGVDGESDTPEEVKRVLDITLALQKIYLAVGKVISTEEARELVNRAGAGLPVSAPDEAKTLLQAPVAAAYDGDGDGSVDERDVIINIGSDTTEPSSGNGDSPPETTSQYSIDPNHPQCQGVAIVDTAGDLVFCATTESDALAMLAHMATGGGNGTVSLAL